MSPLLIADRAIARGFKRSLKGGMEVPAVMDNLVTNR
jgi:hypothetical protein